MYHGLLRIGEVTEGPHVIKAKDVHKNDKKNKYIMILHTSKTHGRNNRPQKIEFGSLDLSTNFFCPVKELYQYSSMRPPYLDDQEQYFVFSNHIPVRPGDVRKILKSIITKLELDADLYDTHSFRIGKATDMFKNGVTVERIKHKGRWKSNAVYKYLRD